MRFATTHTTNSLHAFLAYRFHFNGQEGDNEVAGVGNSYTAEFWQYDSRLGRRWNVDPVVKPWESPYATFSNNPVFYVDPDGLDAETRVKKYQKKNGGVVKEKDGVWSVDKGFEIRNSDGRIADAGVVSKIFKDNIFERSYKAISNSVKIAVSSAIKFIGKLFPNVSNDNLKTGSNGSPYINQEHPSFWKNTI